MPPRQRRVWAYLHYRADGRNVTRYVGEATADTRAEALRKAWQKAHAKELLNQSSARPATGRPASPSSG